MNDRYGTNARISRIVDSLIEKTRAKKIDWTDCDGRNRFGVNLGRSRVSVNLDRLTGVRELEIVSGNGVRIAESSTFGESDFSKSGLAGKLNDLWEEARRSALNADSVLDEIGDFLDAIE